jgi:hypothetical protein
VLDWPVITTVPQKRKITTNTQHERDGGVSVAALEPDFRTQHLRFEHPIAQNLNRSLAAVQSTPPGCFGQKHLRGETQSQKLIGHAIGDSVLRKICVICAVSAIRGCLRMLVTVIKGLPTVQSRYEPPPGRVLLTKKVRKKRKKPLPPRSRGSCCEISPGRSLTPGTPLLPVTNGTIVPFVIRRACPLAAVDLGFPVVWRLLSCQNCSVKSTR